MEKWVRAIQSDENGHGVAVLKIGNEKFRNVICITHFLAILFKNV
jgi:hypothetical protein